MNAEAKAVQLRDRCVVCGTLTSYSRQESVHRGTPGGFSPGNRLEHGRLVSVHLVDRTYVLDRAVRQVHPISSAVGCGD
jgi:hypothetical protein